MDEFISRSRSAITLLALAAAIGVATCGVVVAAVPDWPELDQPSPDQADAYRLAGLHWSTRAELGERYGSDNLIYVEVVNEAELAVKRKLGYVLRQGAPDAEFCYHNASHALLGPVKDFASFCRKLDFAEILEQDALGKYVKIKADPLAYFHRAGGVHLEIANAQVLLAGDSSRRDDPWSNFSLSLQLAAQPPKHKWEIHGLNSDASRYECAPVIDFEQFCHRLTYVDILEKDATSRTLKLHLKPEKLTGDATLKRVGSIDKLASWDRERLESSDQDESQLVAAARDPALPRRALSERIARRRAAMGMESPRSSPQSTLRESVSSRSLPGFNSDGGFPSADDPEFHKKLCELMLDEGNWPLHDKTIDALLSLDPQDVEDKAIRQQIARNFRTLAEQDGPPEDVGKAIRGLVLFGGKYSVPILIDMIEQEQLEVNAEVFHGLAKLKDPRGARAAAKTLGNFFNHKQAVSCLREMGPVAEDALMEAAPSDDPNISLAAVQLLGEVGTPKCLDLLARAAASSNPEIVEAARASTKAIRQRARNAAQ